MHAGGEGGGDQARVKMEAVTSMRWNCEFLYT